MATVHVTLSRVTDRRAYPAPPLLIITSVPESVQTMTSSGTSAVSTIAATKADGLVWSVTPTGNVFVKFGTGTPVAASGDGHLVLAGQTRDFSVTTTGEKIAVKDAA